MTEWLMFTSSLPSPLWPNPRIFYYIFQTLQSNSNNTSNSLRALDWSHGKYSTLNSALFLYDWDLEFLHFDTDHMANHLTSILYNLTKHYIPSKLHHNWVAPWHKRISQQLKRQRSGAWAKYVNCRRTFSHRSHLTLQKLHSSLGLTD